MMYFYLKYLAVAKFNFSTSDGTEFSYKRMTTANPNRVNMHCISCCAQLHSTFRELSQQTFAITHFPMSMLITLLKQVSVTNDQLLFDGGCGSVTRWQ